MSYILEDQIKWDELSPSLKARFNKLITRITDLRTKVNNTSPGKDETLSNLFLSNPMDGQILKIDSKKNIVFADDDFRNIKIVENDSELAEEMNYKPISLANVFSSWYRYAHSDNWALSQLVTNSNEHSFGTWQNQGYLDIWSYNPATGGISQHVNDAPVCGFVNPIDFYTNYYLRVRYTTGDDDNTFLVVGYMKDVYGVEHTLSVFRGAHSDTICYWAFIYDAGNPTQHKIIDYTGVVGSQPSGTFYFSVKRSNSSFEFKTAPANSSTDIESWTMRWSYPSTKPSNMPQAEYDNIGVMMTKTNRVGFGVRSMETTFYIDKQVEIFDDGDIYALHTDQVWRFNESSGQWVVIGNIRDILPDRIFLFNSRKNKFYFRNYWGKWTKISSTD